MSGKIENYFFLLILLFTSCKLNSSNQLNKDLSLPPGYTSALRTIVVSDTTLTDSLKYYYSINNYQPAFIKSSNDKNTLDNIIRILNGCKDHGISPSIYNISEIENEFLLANDTTLEGLTHLAKSELLLTEAVVNYSNHLRFGVINPEKIVSGYYMPVTDSSKRNLLEVIGKENLENYFSTITPKSIRYLKLQNALKKFDSLSLIPWKKISAGSNIKDLIGRLAILGYIDSSEVNPKWTYKQLKEVIKDVQRSYGLNPDGNLGQTTLEKLNIPPSVYVEKIKLNLERFRWNNYADSSRYLLVNIPDFYLRAIEKGKEQFNIKVCTGRKRSANYYERYQRYIKTYNIKLRPDDWETPQLISEVSYMILNPTWTVPYNIVREEIYSGVSKDSLYLQKRNFKAFRNGKEVDINSIDIRKYSPTKVPFTFVQGSGNGNALGKMKFMFKNSFDVYLHDTPTRPPFSRTNRAVSHGCIRVEKPLQLADYLLNNNSKWNVDYIKIETGQSSDNNKIEEFKNFKRSLGLTVKTGETTEVRLIKRIPVIIDYYTSWVDEKGIINLRDDVYGKDSQLKKYLKLFIFNQLSEAKGN